MSEADLIKAMARKAWECWMIDPAHGGAEMPTWEMLLLGEEFPQKFPAFAEAYRQAITQQTEAFSVIREGGWEVFHMREAIIEREHQPQPKEET